jgi:hypothetical protein
MNCVAANSQQIFDEIGSLTLECTRHFTIPILFFSFRPDDDFVMDLPLSHELVMFLEILRAC